MIEIKNLNKYFFKGRKNEIHVINNINLSLKDNGLVAFLGESGCGKTTLLNVIGGLDKVKKGSIYLDEKKITTKFTYKKDKIRNISIGYIFQDYKLIDNLSVFDNIALVLKMIGIKDKKEITKRVNFVLEKVNMYRYRNRYANMLSGGEKQRVAIARAIVKDPDIILADEPTGNLDSKNSLEVMNIIKAISKNKLILLVTHEESLANFYADRIIKLEDGKIIKDYKNNNKDDLDYGLDNTIYLKDIKNHKEFSDNNILINTYNDSNKPMNIDIVYKNGNIYIKTNNQNKIEVIDNDSTIELKDSHYQKISEEEMKNYEFNFDNIIDKSQTKKYSSIFNIFTLIINGFKRIFSYTMLKKILLVGFFLAGMFIMFSVSSIYGTKNIKDNYFIKYNRNYLKIDTIKKDVNEYLNYENNEDVNYIIPGDSMIGFNIKNTDYYQTSSTVVQLTGSLADISLISEDSIIEGVMPTNDYEIVIDKTVVDKSLDYDIGSPLKGIGILSYSDMLGRVITIPNMPKFRVVGITDSGSPSIYASKTIFINMLANNTDNYYYEDLVQDGKLIDYTLLQDSITLVKGRMPSNAYEVIVNNENKDSMPLNKPINTKVNGVKLTVVGYYTNINGCNAYLVNNDTVKYNIVNTSNSMMLVVNEDKKDEIISSFKEQNVNIKDSYLVSKDEYIKDNEEANKTSIFISSIILGISLVEIYLMMRSSFLSRIKEIGILRAIGVKKSDIYKMFLGEIVAITTIFNVSGILVMTYVLNVLAQESYFSRMFLINQTSIISAIILVYIFNIIIGLLPVFNTVRKTPASILARHDIE